MSIITFNQKKNYVKKPYGIYLPDILTQMKNNVHSTVFSIALFIITKDWNPPKSLSL